MEATKKPFYKRWRVYAYTFAALIVIGVLVPENVEPEVASEVAKPKTVEVAAVKSPEEVSAEASKAKLLAEEKAVAEAESNKAEIDTSVFEYALGTEVTDAIDINAHVTVFVQMSEDLKPGMATQHVVQQTFDFVQQNDVAEAETVTIAVKQGGVKIAQITVDTAKFVPDEDTPMISLVIEASEIDFMTDEVKEYGKTLELW